MADQGQSEKPESNPAEEVFEVTEQHIQNIITYISNLSSAVIDADPEKIKSLFSLEQNASKLRLFISDESSKIICLTKNEEEQIQDPSKEYIFETEPSFKDYKNSTIIFIKKVPRIDCTKQKLIKRDIQMLNFIGGNDISMFSYMLNCIQSAFSPLFTSFQKSLRPDLKNVTSKLENCKDVNLKMNELVILLDKAQTNSEIFDVKLETLDIVKEKVNEFLKKNEKPPSVDDIKPFIDEKNSNKICDMINKWKIDIINFNKVENDLNKGDTLDEINFWKKKSLVLNNIKKQIESPENKIMWELAKLTKKGFGFNNSFDDEIKLKESINNTQFINMNLKDIDIIGLLKTSSISEISPFLISILDIIKNNTKTAYPIERKLKLLGKIKQDMNKHIIKLLGNKLMTMDYEEFCKICKELNNILDTIWKSKIKEIHVKFQNNYEKINLDSSINSNNLEDRIKELQKMREEHNNFLELSQNLIFGQQSENEEEFLDKQNDEMKSKIQDAYDELSKIDILDLSSSGEKKWIEAKDKYKKKMEEIENTYSTYLKEQLEKAKNSNEQYKIFKRFQQLSQKQRINLGLQQYQSAFIEEIKNHLQELLDTLLAGYNANTASKMSKIKRIPEISGNIIWLKQFEKKAISLGNKAEVILGENWENLNDGKKIKDLIGQIKRHSDTSRLLDKYNKETTTIPDDIGNERIMDIVKKKNEYELKVNFDEKLIDKFKEYKMIFGKSNNKTNYIKERCILW